MGVSQDQRNTYGRLPPGFRQRLPDPIKRLLGNLYWKWYDLRDFIAEIIGWVPSHHVRLFLYRTIAGVKIGKQSSIHRGCRFYRPSGVTIANNVIINRDVLLDGRMDLTIEENVSVSEGVQLITLEHDPNSPTFEMRGAPIVIRERAFIGAQAMVLPGVTIQEGAVVAARAVVTRDVSEFTIVAGAPARPIGERCRDLVYQLNYRKWLS